MISFFSLMKSLLAFSCVLYIWRCSIQSSCLHPLVWLPTRLVHLQRPIKPESALAQSLFMVIEFLSRRRAVRSLPFQSRIFMWPQCQVREFPNYWLCVYFKIDSLCGYLIFLILINTFQVEQNLKFFKILKRLWGSPFHWTRYLSSPT